MAERAVREGKNGDGLQQAPIGAVGRPRVRLDVRDAFVCRPAVEFDDRGVLYCFGATGSEASRALLSRCVQLETVEERHGLPPLRADTATAVFDRLGVRSLDEVDLVHTPDRLCVARLTVRADSAGGVLGSVFALRSSEVSDPWLRPVSELPASGEVGLAAWSRPALRRRIDAYLAQHRIATARIEGLWPHG